MKRLSRIVVTVLIFISMGALLSGCARQGSASASEEEIVTVQRGDLTLDISAAGNLALSVKEDLAFEMDGTVEAVLVAEADSVEEGQLLAKLDVSVWEERITELEDKVSAAERNVASAKRQLTSKERALVTAERQITSKEYAVRQAEIDLKAAENAIDQIAEVKAVQDKIDVAEDALQFAKTMLAGQFAGVSTLTDYNYWSQVKAIAERQLAEARKEKSDLLAGTGLSATSDLALEIARKQLQVEQKQTGLGQAQLEVEYARQDAKSAEQDVKDAKLTIGDAERALAKARRTLDEARATSPEIKAPFAGFITKVNVKGGGTVKKGTVAVQLADPNKFEAEILVNEMDFPSVRLGGSATVKVDALSGVSLPGTVSYISPTAVIQAGVVNYKVKVEVLSIEEARQQQREKMQAAMQARQQAAENATQAAPQGQLPEQLERAIASGRITREQAEQMRERLQAGGFQRQFGGAGGMPFLAGGDQNQSPAPTQGATPVTTRENLQLREGMTITVSIITQQKSNVLLVPNGAITTRGGQRYVTVVSSSGAKEERLVQTGISDWQYTEVTSGLSQGDRVVVTRTTTPSSSTSSQRGQPQPGMFPGIQRIIR